MLGWHWEDHVFGADDVPEAVESEGARPVFLFERRVSAGNELLEVHSQPNSATEPYLVKIAITETPLARTMTSYSFMYDSMVRHLRMSASYSP